MLGEDGDEGAVCRDPITSIAAAASAASAVQRSGKMDFDMVVDADFACLM